MSDIQDEQELLAQYRADGNRLAFAELVRRHGDRVYSAERRQLADAHVAEDVTQAVFALLALKADRVKGPLAGWLLRTTWYVCRDVRKRAVRRQFHERRAAEMRPLNPAAEGNASAPEPAWEDYAPLVDEALAQLGGTLRSAVALRYFGGKSLKEVGQCLGISDDGARKRVQKGIERLRKLLGAKTVVPSAAVLATHLTSHGMLTAPAGLLEAIGRAGPAPGSAASLIARRAARMMRWRKLRIVAIGTIVVLIAVGAAMKGLQTQTPAATQAAAPLPTAAGRPVTADLPEIQVPGGVRMAHWSLILNQVGEDFVAPVGKPVPSSSTVYQAISCNADELRQAAAKALARRGVDLMGYSASVDRGYGWPHEFSFNQPPIYASDIQAGMF